MTLLPINNSTSSGIFRWRPACWLRCHGPDAAAFLQSQFSNDLRALEHQPAVYGLWLSVKGKVVADSFVLRGGGADSFYVGSYASPAGVVRQQLESHLIADDVTVEDETAAWAAVSLFGEAAVAAAQGVETGFMLPGRRARTRQWDWVFAAGDMSTVDTRLAGVPELTAESVERIRISEGLPAVPADIGPADLPNEGGLEADAISYSKGCYLGQEVMARLKSLGQVRRRLLRVHGRGAPPATPAPLFAGERAVGELRSAVADGAEDFIGLAMLSRLNVTVDSELGFAPGGEPRVRLLEAP